MAKAISIDFHVVHPETPFEPGEHNLELDISTIDEECGLCHARIRKADLMVFFQPAESPRIGAVLCLGCARKKLEAFLPIWEERQRATVPA